jgi:hypothetical protein
MQSDASLDLSPSAGDYLLAAAGAWLLWLVATSFASSLVTFAVVPPSAGADAVALEATLMLFSRTGLLLVVVLEFVISPIIVRVLLRYGLARIAIYMMLYAVVWLAILVGPLAAVFGMAGILREMAWLTLFMLWGAWNWWVLAHRPLLRAIRATTRASIASLQPLHVSESPRG